MKIYTKTGDTGQTSLYGGKRIPKDDQQIEAYGSTDELNSHIGLLLSLPETEAQHTTLNLVQHELFNIGSHLATSPDKEKLKRPVLHASKIEILEQEIDAMEKELEPLTHFVLPGGSKENAYAHIARTVCRRCERIVVGFAHENEFDSHIITFINRLSDYLFVLARWIAKEQNIEEIKWIPEKQ